MDRGYPYQWRDCSRKMTGLFNCDCGTSAYTFCGRSAERGSVVCKAAGWSRPRMYCMATASKEVGMRALSFAIALVSAAVSIGSQTAQGQSEGVTQAGAASACKALGETDFTRIIHAPSKVTSAKFVEANADIPAYCEVGGAVAPSVGFLLRLPAA